MKRHFIFLLFFVWLGCKSEAPPVASVVDLPEHINKTTFLQEVNSFLSNVDVLQAEFFRKNGFYFQGIAFPDSVRGIAEDRIAFSKIRKPTDQQADWALFGLPDLNVRGQYRIDVYNAPGNKWGYVVTIRIMYPDGNIYRLSVNTGVEDYRNTQIWVKESRISNFGK